MAQITITRKIKLLASAEYQPSYENTVSTGRNIVITKFKSHNRKFTFKFHGVSKESDMLDRK